MNTTTIGSRYPAKPVRKEPVHQAKEANTAEALELLNQFIREARKEIRKRSTISVVGTQSKATDYDAVTFLSDNFSLTINFTEGIAV